MSDEHYGIGVFILSIIAIIMGLCTTNWSLTFYKLWTELHVEAIAIRRPTSGLLFGICCSFALLIRNPMTLYVSLSEKLFADIFWIQTFLLHLTTVALIYLLVYRTWLVYFNIKWVQALEDFKWQSQIDTKTLAQSWYIQKKQIWGNPKQIALVTFIPWLAFCVLGTLLTFITSNEISLFCVLFSTIFGITILSIICFKMPKYDDYYKLRVETKRLSLTYICLTITQFILTWILQTKIGEWKYIILQTVHISMLFTVGYISFYWVFKQFGLPTFVCHVNKHTAAKKLGDIIDRQKSDTTLTIKHILKNEELFMKFARQLSAEFAIENLLYYIELYQFTNFIESNQLNLSTNSHIVNVNIESDTSSSSITDIVITDKAPQSTIVAELKDKKDVNDVYIAAIQLYLKYIDFNAYYLINISYDTRQAFAAVFGTFSDAAVENRVDFMTKNNVQIQEICAVFDACRKEIYRLLVSSVIRFKRGSIAH